VWTDTGQLVGRLEELGAIRHALRDRHGVHLLVIEGAPGIGKTRLLEEAAATADAGGARVLRARGSELERELPFGVMRQLLEPALGGVPAPERAELLSGDAALAAPALDLRPTQHIVDGFAVLSGLYWLIAGIAAAEPLVLCLDDLHWSDEPSLRALAYLLGRLDGVDAQLCVALRPHEPESEEALIHEITSTPRAVTIRPSPLDRDAVTALVRTRLDPGADAAFCAACEASTQGNPLLLCELARELAERGVAPTAAAAPAVGEVIPRGIAPSVLRRVKRVHPQASSVAGAVAILGDGAEPRLVAALAGLDPGAANAVLESLTRVEVLARADPPSFVHPLVRAAIAAAVDADDRGRLHLEAARLLAADGAPPERLAVHLTETPPGDDPWVVDTLIAAGQEAMARGAPGPAARLLRRALEEPPPAGQEAAVLLATGQAEARAGDARAIAHLQRAIESAPDGATHAEAALLLVQLLGPAGQLKAGIDLALNALARLDPDSELWRRLEAEMLSLAVMDSSHRAFAVQRLARLDPAMPVDGQGACMLLAILSNEALARGRSRDEVAALAERALAGGWLMESILMHAHATNALMHSGHYRQTIAVWGDFMAHARARGDVVGVSLAHAFRAAAHWHAGSLDEAIADADLSMHIGPARVSALTAAFALAFKAEALVLRGDLEAARTTIALAAGPEDQLPSPILLSARGRLRLAEGRLLDALEDMRLVGRLVEQWMSDNTALAPWRAEAALALHGLGQTAEARELIAWEVAGAHRWGDPWLLGQALRAQALVGPESERIPVLGEAVALLRPSEARLELALALLELGAAQHASGDARPARQALREVLELATDCAAPAVADRARTALIAAGGRPRRAAATGPLALTPTERRVARIAASGAGNREIAQTLFVTEKTIETHLASAYRKLGIRARGQLAGALTSSA
jgi:DNA-binding CsgD family transcriptional regulator